jgi:small subunit ribosomal protein S2
MMSDISIQEMMDAGAHFGHQTRRWNPKMKPYLYGARSGVHIIDLQQTQELAQSALKAIENVVAKGESVLFVGTKKQAQPVIEEQAKRVQMPYVIRRWLGGMLTNFVTIRKSVDKLLEYEMRREKQEFAGLTKKELLGVDREIVKLTESFGGIKAMKRLPGAVFVVDPMVEKIAVHEANILGIPVIAITDSNCDPDPIDYIIPANDDALRSIQVLAFKIADACLNGM